MTDHGERTSVPAPGAGAADAAAEALRRLNEAVEAFPADEDGGRKLPKDLVQSLMALAVRSYVALYRGAEGDEAPLPIDPAAGITATEVAITADGLLESADMDVFELQMWRSMGRR